MSRNTNFPDPVYEEPNPVFNPVNEIINPDPGHVCDEHFIMNISSAYGVNIETDLPDVISKNSAYNIVSS